MTTSIKPYAVRRISPTEQQLAAARHIQAGELILCEQPIVHVRTGHYQYGTYAWDLVAILIADKEKWQAYSRCKLLASRVLMHPEDLEIEAHLVKKYSKSRQFVRTLYAGVATNNVGVINEARAVQGHGVYPILSRSDHSCLPNCVLQPANWRAGEAALAAKQDIRLGEALTWSYFRETEFLPQDWTTRNYNLVNLFRFACRCPRCEAERPREVPSSQAGQVAYFDKLLYAQAKEMANAPLSTVELLAQFSGAAPLSGLPGIGMSRKP